MYNSVIRQKLHEAGIDNIYTKFHDGRQSVTFIDQAAASFILGELVKLYGPVDAPTREYDFSGFGSDSFEVERGWGVSCSIRFRAVGHRHELTDDNDIPVIVRSCTIDPVLSWSSTGRTIAESRASIELYTEMVKLAEVVVSTFNYEILTMVKNAEVTKEK